MSIVVRFRPTNLTPELYAESRARLDEAVGFPPDGLDYHVCFDLGGGELAVSEIWDSREQFAAFGERLMPVLTDIGIELRGDPEIFEVHDVAKR